MSDSEPGTPTPVERVDTGVQEVISTTVNRRVGTMEQAIWELMAQQENRERKREAKAQFEAQQKADLELREEKRRDRRERILSRVIYFLAAIGVGGGGISTFHSINRPDPQKPVAEVKDTIKEETKTVGSRLDTHKKRIESLEHDAKLIRDRIDALIDYQQAHDAYLEAILVSGRRHPTPKSDELEEAEAQLERVTKTR